MKKFSIIHYDDAVGKENLAAVELALTRRGLKPSSIATLKRNQTDLGATVSDVVKAEPDVVIATTLYKTTGDFIKSARKAGSGAQFASTSFVGASALANELGDQGTGVVVAQVVPPYARASIPIVREYQAAIEKSLAKRNIPSLRWSRTSEQRCSSRRFDVPARARRAKAFSRRSIRCRTSMWAAIWSISARRITTAPSSWS